MINKGMFTSDKDDWQTPKWLFNKLNKHFKFNLDVCANDENALCEKYYTSYDSCLDKDWEMCNFMNPPYGRQISKFVSESCLKTLAASFILSRIDYCNALYKNLNKYQIDKIQKLQNFAAKVVPSISAACPVCCARAIV